MFDFLDVPVAGAYHLVTWLATVAHPLLGELSTAAVIVLFTAGVRLLLHPLARAAVRGQEARAALAPQAQALRLRYRDDPRRLQRELTALYRQAGTTILAGCLPALLQVPFFTVMYRLFTSTSVAGTANPMLGHTLFGAPLGGHLVQAFSTGPFGPAGVVFLGLLAALALVAWFCARGQAGPAGTADLPGAVALRLLPFGTLLAAAVLPLAAGLYLLTSTTWTVAERAALRRPPGAGG